MIIHVAHRPMAHVTGYSHDVFISYSHLDDQAVEGEGWVTGFHRRLQIELDEELGEKAALWRDPRIGAAADFTADLEKQLRGSAIVLAIVSPGYLNSRWCEWELRGFVDGVRRVGDLWVDSKCRAVKAIKRPSEGNAHREAVLRETTGVELFETDPASGRSYELAVESEVFQRRLTELAQDICGILRHLRRERTVFLGSAPSSLTAQRTKVNDELIARQYRVLSAPAEDVTDAPDIVRRAVQESSLSIHFVTHEADGAASDPAVTKAAVERDIANRSGLPQVVVVRDQQGPTGQKWDLGAGTKGSDVEVLVDPPTYALKETVLEKLRKPVERTTPQKLVRVYLICERQDHPLLAANRARSLRDHLLRRGLEVKVPLAEGSDAGEFSRDNRTKLKTCDGVLLYWGGSRQSWFEERLIELTQALGWRRGRSFTASAAYVADPPNPVKENYETREVEELIKQFDTLDVQDERLVRFIARLDQPA
jgi:hypothetical protein